MEAVVVVAQVELAVTGDQVEREVMVVLVFNFRQHLEIQHQHLDQMVVVWVCLVHLVLIGLQVEVAEVQEIPQVLVVVLVDHMLVVVVVLLDLVLQIPEFKILAAAVAALEMIWEVVVLEEVAAVVPVSSSSLILLDK